MIARLVELASYMFESQSWSTQRWICLKMEEAFNWFNAETDGKQSKFEVLPYMFETNSKRISKPSCLKPHPCKVRFFPDSWRGVGTATTEGVQLMVGGAQCGVSRVESNQMF